MMLPCALQDKEGQYEVVLCREDEQVRAISSSARSLNDSDADVEINKHLKRSDASIGATLQKYAIDQIKGAWLNELCEKYYKGQPLHNFAKNWQWPRSDKDRELREILRSQVRTGRELKQTAEAKLGLKLV